MADVFLRSDALNLLEHKFILLLGDSNVRAVYKDLVWLLNSNSLIENHILKRKLEFSYLGDKLLVRSELHKGRDFEEVREFQQNQTKVKFHFLTKCLNDKLENLLLSFKSGRAPDIVYMSSAIWDIARWGPNGVAAYKNNLVSLMKLMKSTLPSTTLFIWGCAPPISSRICSAFLIEQLQFLKKQLRFEILEANFFARQIVTNYGFDVLDIHHHLLMHIQRMSKDGIHYINLAVRYLTNLLLTHIALAWNVQLPGNVHNSRLMKKIEAIENRTTKMLDQHIPTVLNQLNAVAKIYTTEKSTPNKRAARPRQQMASNAQQTNNNNYCGKAKKKKRKRRNPY